MAVGRALGAVLENYAEDADWFDQTIPEVLRPFLSAPGTC